MGVILEMPCPGCCMIFIVWHPYYYRMWGVPSNLSSLTSTIRDTYSSSNDPGGVDLEVLVAESNQYQSHTYDGIVWGGERLRIEVGPFLKFVLISRISRNDVFITRFKIILKALKRQEGVE